MKNIIILTIITLFIFDKLYSQVTLTGRVTDKATKQSIPGANVYLPDLKTIAVTDSNGYYKIDNLPRTKILIQVSMFGYKVVIENVDLSKTTVKNFALETSVKELNEVVVTGTSRSTEITKNPVPIAVISKKYIEENNNTNIIEALSKVPGLSTVTTGPNISKPYIHGLGYNRVLTLFDGVRQEGQQWGDEHGVEVDQFLVDHIEVIKGPASLMYGSDALAGVVNLLPANPVLDGTIKGSVLGNYLTNNKQIAGSLALDGNNNGFIWGFRSSHKQAIDYDNPIDGRVYGTKYKENDFDGYIGLHKAWGYTHLNFSLFDDLQEIPDGSRDSLTRKFTKQITEGDTIRPIVSNSELNNYKIATLHQHIQHYRIYSLSNFFIGESRLALSLGFQQSIRREFSHPEYPDIAGLYLILNTFTYDVKYYLPESDRFETTFGINGMVQNNNADRGTEFVIPSYHSFDLGPFAHINRIIGKWDVSAGVRYDIRIYKNDSMFTKPNHFTGFDMQTDYDPNDKSVVKQFDYYNHTFSEASGSIGATYNISDNIGIKFNVARGYRAPNAAEISAKGVHPGTGFEQHGDQNFKPEFSLQEDGGIFINSPHLTVNLELFNNNINNYIYDEKLISVKGDDSIFIQNGNKYPVFKFRQTTSELYGGEIDVEVHPHPFEWLHFENSLSYIYALNLGGNGAAINASNKYLPLIPPLHTNSELRAELRKRFRYLSSAYVKFGVQCYATQNHYFAANGTETSTPVYVLFDAGIGGNVTNKKGKTMFTISIIGTNLTNLAYQSNMDRLKYFEQYSASPNGHLGIFEMGRNISFRILVPIDLKRKPQHIKQ